MPRHANFRGPSRQISDIELWRRAQESDAHEDDAARLLELAAYADGASDEDERQLVAEWLTAHPEIAHDIATAISSRGISAEPAPESIVQRATALVPGSAEIIRFPSGRRTTRAMAGRVLTGWTGWGGFVAAMAVASWLGFTLGVDTTRTWIEASQSDEGLLREMLDPSAGFVRDLSDGSQT